VFKAQPEPGPDATAWSQRLRHEKQSTILYHPAWRMSATSFFICLWIPDVKKVELEVSAQRIDTLDAHGQRPPLQLVATAEGTCHAYNRMKS
jgi:hypothetical protein